MFIINNMGQKYVTKLRDVYLVKLQVSEQKGIRTKKETRTNEREKRERA